MSELKKGFSEIGFVEVTSYLNSGNIIFSSSVDDKSILSNKIELMIKDRFDLDIPVFITLQEELIDILDNAPDWWGDDNKEIYDNLIFIMPPISSQDIYDEIGEPKVEYETVYNYKNAIFWSFSRKNYQKTNWWSKTASFSISDKITIRTVNTVRKIAGM